MISRVELRRVARARLADAEALAKAGRYDGAVYLCGYAVEIGLKCRICRTLKWADFPTTAGSSSRIRASGHTISASCCDSPDENWTSRRSSWLNGRRVKTWSPDVRYKAVGSATGPHARAMIQAAQVLLKAL
jgi:HEPN domain-containing protein